MIDVPTSFRNVSRKSHTLDKSIAGDHETIKLHPSYLLQPVKKSFLISFVLCCNLKLFRHYTLGTFSPVFEPEAQEFLLCMA
mmetsp:Transcript_3378/g.6149  ORF Transcript_3378/g.6149 Transcript_3378/m.6149 type:complete len:82 (+) Transcript_3378:95-340(+)